jgi:hypothetical protein
MDKGFPGCMQAQFISNNLQNLRAAALSNDHTSIFNICLYTIDEAYQPQ